MIETLEGRNPTPHLIIVPGSPLSGLMQETSHGPLEGEQFGLKVVFCKSVLVKLYHLCKWHVLKYHTDINRHL